MLAIILLVPGSYAVDKTGSPPRVSMPPLPCLPGQSGPVALAHNPLPARFSFDKAAGKIESAGDVAGTAAGNVLAIHTSGPAEIVVGVGTAALAPVVAVKAAIGAGKRLSPDQLTEQESSLARAMAEMAAPQQFQQCLLRAAKARCPGRLVPADPAPAAVPDEGRFAAVLDARIDDLHLERTGRSDKSYALRIKMHARLARTSDGAVLYDAPAEYRSGKGLFLDWTLQGVFQGVAETGYGELAEQIVNRLLVEPPLLLGAGFQPTPVTPESEATRFASLRTPPPQGGARHANWPSVGLGSLGIYSATATREIRFEKPLTRQEAVAEAQQETEWLMDGLDDHPNPLISLPACALAAPVGLWKQITAAFCGVSPRKLRKADAVLSAVGRRVQPQQELALEVASHLAPLLSQPVTVLHSLPPGTDQNTTLLQCTVHTASPGGSTVSGNPDRRGVDTVLGILVEHAALTGNGRVNSKVALNVEARAVLVRVSDGRQLWSCPLRYRSETRKYTAWAAHDAGRFHSELQNCCRQLSAAMVEHLVRTGMVPPPQASPHTLAGK